MLPGERSLPEAIVAPDGQTVNRLFAWLCDQADHGLALGFQATLREVQRHWFENQRGRMRCPTCRSLDLIRKGWRSRVLATSRGRLQLTVLQAHCKNCRRTFRPLNKALGLPSSRRLLDELMEKAVFLGTQVSFARSADMLKQLTGGVLSAEGIRRHLARQAALLQLPEPMSGQTVLVDSTKVKAGAKERGEPVYLAITAEPGPLKNQRPSCRKQLVHLHVGNSKQLKRRLKAMKCTHVVHDGGEDLTGCALHVQRCRWHLHYQLKHYLWQDGVPFAMRGAFQETMSHILGDRHRGPERYQKWQENLAQIGLITTANHLSNAANEAFSYLKEPFDYIDTSPLEREMRELNRRADIGARWSPQGLENVLKLLFHQRLNEPSKGST
jgi:hypothetical protein